MVENELSEQVNAQPETTYLKNYHAPDFSVTHLDLQFDLYDDATLVTSKMQLTRHSDAGKSRELLLHGEELTLESLKLNGVALSDEHYEISTDKLIISNMPDTAELEIVVRIYPQKNTALLGLYRSNNTYCTQCEAEGFRRITYYQDRPDVLTTFTTTITADKATHPVLLSNGNLIDQGDADNGRHWVKWEDPFKKPSYLFALVAGDFDLVTDTFTTQSGRKIDLRIYVDKGFADQTQHAMFSLKEAMRWDEEKYGREYDLDIYMIVAIGDFVMGAMENKGLNIFNTKYVLAKPETATDDDYIHILSVIGHEYFHNWTGNRVTCRDWFQLSLKEGLTIFRDQSFSEDVLSESVMRIHGVTDLRESQFPEDAGPLAHNVQPDAYIEINNFYTSTIYNKGAEILRMMQTLLGVETFRSGMDLYFERHDGQAVTIDDFVKVMEDVSGVDLSQFKRWYTQAGTPVVSVSDEYDPANKRYILSAAQHTAATPGQEKKEPLLIPILMGLLDQKGNELRAELLQLKDASQTFTFENIDSKPTVSLFRKFSAPVKLNYSYSDADLAFLAKYDTDAYNRWESTQKYLLKLLLAQVKEHQQGRDLHVPDECIDLLAYLLNDHSDNPFLLAEMLTLPTESYIGEQMDVVDVDAIHAAREFLITTIAKKLHQELSQIYLSQKTPMAIKQFDVAAIAARKLKNRCLLYLMYLPEYLDLGMKQFTSGCRSNMTDTLPALVGLCSIDVPQRTQALDEFYNAWKAEPLVVDKWLSVQATSKLPGTLQQVKKLMNNDAFDIKNPNKVYSLIGAFAHRNHINFHLRNGEGYAFLREVVQQLDALNPQVAGRMIKPLTHWRRYDAERQALMQQQLQILAKSKLSPDLYELVNKSL